MTDRKIGVIGDFILDVETYTSSIYYTPEDDTVPILIPNDTKYKFGGAANTANTLYEFYDNVKLYCSVNFEEIHKKTNLLTTNKLIVENIRSKLYPIEKHRIYKNNKLFARLDYDYGVIPIANELLENKLNEDKNDLVVVSDYNKGTITDYKSIFSNNHFTIVDTKGDFFKYTGATIIKCNKKELFKFLNPHTNYYTDLDVRVFEGYEHLLKQISSIYIVTDGSKGCHFIDYEDKKYKYFPAKNIEVVDTIGAGDAFTAGLALSLFKAQYIAGSTIMQAIDAAMDMAQISVTKRGTNVIRKHEFKL